MDRKIPQGFSDRDDPVDLLPGPMLLIDNMGPAAGGPLLIKNSVEATNEVRYSGMVQIPSGYLT